MFRSMRVQTAAIIIIGLILSHAAAYFLYAQDRRDSLLMTEALDIAERAAGISRLVRDVPPEWQPGLLAALDGRAFRVWISANAPFEQTEPTAEETEIVAYLRSQLFRIAGNEMRVRLVSDGSSTAAPPPRSEPSRSASSGPPVSDPPGRHVAITIQHGGDQWLNFLGPINTPDSLLPEFLGLSIISAVLGIGLVAFWLVHRVTVPLTRLARAAERFGRTVRAEPLPENGPREVATAAAAFNRMQRRLVEMVEGRTELLAAISHDLRTPITQMRLRTELTPPSADREKTLRALDDMEATVATFLEFARASHDTEQRRRSDIGTLVESICADLADTGAEISCETEDALIADCKRQALKRGISNLIENALKYGGSAHVEVRRASGGIIVRVEDQGPGIPEKELQAVFSPFHRGEASRNRDTGGVGLGLSIAQAVAEDHGGEIRLINRPEGGLRAELLLPV